MERLARAREVRGPYALSGGSLVKALGKLASMIPRFNKDDLEEAEEEEESKSCSCSTACENGACKEVCMYQVCVNGKCETTDEECEK